MSGFVHMGLHMTWQVRPSSFLGQKMAVSQPQVRDVAQRMFWGKEYEISPSRLLFHGSAINPIKNANAELLDGTPYKVS